MATKSVIRSLLAKRIQEMPITERAAESERLCNRVRSLTGNTIGIYLALPDEPDLRSALTRLLDSGITLALPFPQSDGSWTFQEIHQLDAESRDTWGLGFPPPGQRIPPENLHRILVPGRGFTPDGHRLGRGKGIYDRLLAGTSAQKIGVCFSCQMIDELPTSGHDIRMDEVWCGPPGDFIRCVPQRTPGFPRNPFA